MIYDIKYLVNIYNIYIMLYIYLKHETLSLTLNFRVFISPKSLLYIYSKYLIYIYIYIYIYIVNT